MALLLATEYGNTGLMGEYWKIVEIRINYLARTSVVLIFQWADQQARLDGKQWLQERQYSWDGAEFPFDLAALDAEGMNHVRAAYEKLRTLPEYAGAVDV